MGNSKWSSIENAIIVGSLPEYRFHIANGMAHDIAVNLVARKILNNDLSFNFLYKRKPPHVQDAVDTIIQHIIRMNEITQGSTLPRPAMTHELPWENILP